MLQGRILGSLLILSSIPTKKLGLQGLRVLLPTRSGRRLYACVRTWTVVFGWIYNQPLLNGCSRGFEIPSVQLIFREGKPTLPFAHHHVVDEPEPFRAYKYMSLVCRTAKVDV